MSFSAFRFPTPPGAGGRVRSRSGTPSCPRRGTSNDSDSLMYQRQYRMLRNSHQKRPRVTTAPKSDSTKMAGAARGADTENGCQQRSAVYQGHQTQQLEAGLIGLLDAGLKDFVQFCRGQGLRCCTVPSFPPEIMFMDITFGVGGVCVGPTPWLSHRSVGLVIGTISGSIVNSSGLDGSTVMRTQWVSGSPKVSIRVKFSKIRFVFLLSKGLLTWKMWVSPCTNAVGFL